MTSATPSCIRKWANRSRNHQSRPASPATEMMASEAVANAVVRRSELTLLDYAKSATPETGAFPELLSIYHLFGDPALTLR